MKRDRGHGQLPRWQRAGICTALYQGVDTSGRTLTFGSGTRLQVYPSKCPTLGPGQRHQECPLCSLGWWSSTSWTNFSCFFMRFECFEIWIPSYWLNSLFSNRNWPFHHHRNILFHGLQIFIWLCQKIYFYFSYKLVSQKVELNFSKTLGIGHIPCPIERYRKNLKPK